MNNSFVFVATIVAIVMCARVMQTWIKQRDKPPVADEDINEALARIDHLEERVRVLERIVTETRADLKQQIDSL